MLSQRARLTRAHGHDMAHCRLVRIGPDIRVRLIISAQLHSSIHDYHTIYLSLLLYWRKKLSNGWREFRILKVCAGYSLYLFATRGYFRFFLVLSVDCHPRGVIFDKICVTDVFTTAMLRVLGTMTFFIWFSHLSSIHWPFEHPTALKILPISLTFNIFIRHYWLHLLNIYYGGFVCMYDCHSITVMWTLTLGLLRVVLWTAKVVGH